MDKKLLEQYKKIYLEEKISDHALQKGREDLLRMLPEQDSPARNTFFRYRFLFAGIILLMLIGTAGMVQAANSGELLYPVKILTNNVAAKIFGKPEINAKKEEEKEKVEIEDQKDLKQEKKEIRGQEKEDKNKPEEDEREQKNEVKGEHVDNLKPDNLRANEVTQIKKRDSEERGQSDKNKSNESDKENTDKDKKENQRKDD